jgi:hypothetical protein
MCFHKLLGLVLCIECSAAIGKKAIVEHIYKSHADAEIRLEHAELQKVLSDLQVKDSFDLKDLPQECPQIEGLHLTQEAYLCSHCQLIRGNLVSIKEHHFAVHAGVPAPMSWTRVTAQQLHHNNRSSYFKVTPTTTAPKANAATQFFLLHQEQREKVVANFDLSKIDPRQVCVWLSATKWHIHVAPYEHSHLVSLVKHPAKAETEFAILAKAVEQYTQKADKAIDTLSTIALQVINTPEPP